MEKLKGKYEIILGFVTLVFSFSAFKDEISKLILDFGFTQLSVANIFLGCIVGFSISLYLYVLELAVRDTKIGGLKIWDFLIKVGFVIFCVILLSPLIVGVSLAINFIVKHIESELFRISTSLIIGVFGVILPTCALILQIIATRKERMELQESIREIDHLERAKNLINDSYYHHAILEIYNVLIAGIKRKLESNGHRVSEQRFEQFVSLIMKEGILEPADVQFITALRNQRNRVAHAQDDEFEVSDATKALVRVSQILQKL